MNKWALPFPANLVTVCILNNSSRHFILIQNIVSHGKTNVPVLGPETVLFLLYVPFFENRSNEDK